MSKRDPSRLLGFFCIAVTAAGCMRDGSRPSTNVAAFSQHIHLSASPAAIRFKIATLSERNDEGVLGPTDYVALTTVVWPQGPDNVIIANQPRVGETAAVPEAFLCTWPPEGGRGALQWAAAPDDMVYNIRALTRQVAKRTIAIPLNAGERVLYIEYTVPQLSAVQAAINYSSSPGANTLHCLFCPIGGTSPAASICSMSRATRL